MTTTSTFITHIGIFGYRWWKETITRDGAGQRVRKIEVGTTSYDRIVWC